MTPRIKCLLTELEDDQSLSDVDGFRIICQEMDQLAQQFAELTLTPPDLPEVEDYTMLLIAAVEIIKNCREEEIRQMLSAELRAQLIEDSGQMKAALARLCKVFGSVATLADDARRTWQEKADEGLGGEMSPTLFEVAPLRRH